MHRLFVRTMPTRTLSVLLSACLMLLAGCATLDLDLASFGRDAAEHTSHVSEVVCLWEAAEGVGLDGLPCRGFAGQILFFAQGRAEPVRIDGDVRVYVFDDHGTIKEQSRPLHEFDFPAEAWNTYLRKTNLGPAYQVFIPYTRKGGRLASCALRVRMSAENRLPLYSKLASVTLPGRQGVDATALAAAQTPADGEKRIEPQQRSITELAAIRRASAEFGVGGSTAQMKRLKTAARSAVQTAGYQESDDEDLPAVSADDALEPTISRRYRMSSGEGRE